MSNSIETAFSQAEKLNFRYYGILYPDDKPAKKIMRIKAAADLTALKEFCYNIPAGEYFIACRHSSRGEIVKYKINTANAVSPVQTPKQDVPQNVPKTQKEVDPEKFGKLTAQLEYQETVIKDLRAENERLVKMVEDLQTEIEDLQDEQAELSDPVPAGPMQQVLDGLKPVIPVLAESLVDFLKSKSNKEPAPAPGPVPIDYDLLAKKLHEQAIAAQQAAEYQQTNVS